MGSNKGLKIYQIINNFELYNYQIQFNYPLVFRIFDNLISFYIRAKKILVSQLSQIQFRHFELYTIGNHL
jgi:hypothetical protein